MVYNARNFEALRPVHSINSSRNHPAEIRRTLALAAPVMIGLIASFSMNFVDTIMAGRLPQRETALAALATGGAVWSAFLMFCIGTLMSVQPTVAQHDGAGRRAVAGGMLRQGFWIACALALPFTLLLINGGWVLNFIGVDAVIVPVAEEYMGALAWGAPAMCMVFLMRFFSEGTGHTRPTMYIGLLGVVLNVPLNWVLMFGKLGMPALGARGCGLATAIVIWLQAMLLVVYIRRHHHFRDFKPFERWERPHWSVISHLLKVGLPIAMTIFVEGSLFVGAALLIGRLGPLPAAGHLVAINFSALMFMIPLGLASAVTTRIGNALGRGEPDSARYAGLIGLFVVLCTQSFTAALIFLFPEWVVGLYTSDAAVAQVAVALLWFAAVFQFPDGIQVWAAGALRGYKDTLVPAVFNVVSYWLIGMTLGYYLTFNQALGPTGMWIGMIAGLTSGAVSLTGRFLWRSKHVPEELLAG